MSLERYDLLPPGLAAVPDSLYELLRIRAEVHPSRMAVIDIDRVGGESATLTYAELLRAALGAAHELHLLGWAGRPVLISSSCATAFAASYFGVLAAGGAPVPIAPGRGHAAGALIARIASDCGAAGLLVDAPTASGAAELLQGLDRRPPLATLKTNRGPLAKDPTISSHDHALIQYTSGSTRAPRGVQVSHANLLHNLACIQAWILGEPGSVMVGWLPLYHDMGLVGILLSPLFSGGTAVVMRPVDFITGPLRWAQAFTKYRAQNSATPNFGLELLLRAARAKGTGGLDLSSLRGIADGAEPVRASTLRDMREVFGPVGLDPDAIIPCYGMAEATLIASAPDRPRFRELLADDSALTRGRYEPDPNGRSLTACGHAMPESELLIVDAANSCVLEDGCVGEVWLRGPSIARSYVHGPGESFGATTSDGRTDCLRTGDLGFLQDGELYLSGRSKNLILIAGRNLHATDLEWTAEKAHPAIAPNSTAAFAVDGEHGEEPVLFVEVAKGADPTELIANLRRAITAEHDCELRAVLPIQRGRLPRTTSGKARRAACRALYESGQVSAVLFPGATPPASP